MIKPFIMDVIFFGIFENPVTFVTFMLLIGALVGAFSTKLSIGAFGGLLIFTHVVMKTDMFIFDALLWLILFIILSWVAIYVVSGYIQGGNEIEGEAT